MKVYPKELLEITDRKIPGEVRKVLLALRWNEFGIYEVIKESINELKRIKKNEQR